MNPALIVHEMLTAVSNGAELDAAQWQFIAQWALTEGQRHYLNYHDAATRCSIARLGRARALDRVKELQALLDKAKS